MSAARLKLDSRLDLRAAEPLTGAILELKGQDLVLDASEVSQIGALAVQVIRSAARTWSEDSVTLSLENASSELDDQLQLLGFTPETLTQWEAA